MQLSQVMHSYKIYDQTFHLIVSHFYSIPYTVKFLNILKQCVSKEELIYSKEVNILYMARIHRAIFIVRSYI